MQKNSQHKLQYDVFDCDFGQCIILIHKNKVCELGFIDTTKDPKSAVSAIMKRYPEYEIDHQPMAQSKLLQEILKNKKTKFAGLIELQGTAFQKRVWNIVRKIPWGHTMTYKEIAMRLGDARLARAVGGAVGANKIGFLIPCHRVLPTRGGIGGFRWGVKRKKQMLEAEGIYLR